MIDTTRAPDAFIDLVCADDDLVRAEFDALIREGWPEEPPGPRLRPHPSAPRRRSTARPHGSTAWDLAADHAPVVDRDGTQRAPPRASHRHAMRRR